MCIFLAVQFGLNQLLEKAVLFYYIYRLFQLKRDESTCENTTGRRQSDGCDTHFGCFSRSKVDNVTNNEFLTQMKENQMNQLKILIAEDDVSSEKLMSIVVRKFAKEIILVETGTEAVEACRSNPDIDLILMDIQMPEMDGYEATRQIREFNTRVVIVAQTAYALSGEKEKAVEAGCNDYISKPIRKDNLMELIQKYF